MIADKTGDVKAYIHVDDSKIKSGSTPVAVRIAPTNSEQNVHEIDAPDGLLEQGLDQQMQQIKKLILSKSA